LEKRLFDTQQAPELAAKSGSLIRFVLGAVVAMGICVLILVAL
jgi:hypothetical protein